MSKDYIPPDCLEADDEIEIDDLPEKVKGSMERYTAGGAGLGRFLALEKFLDGSESKTADGKLDRIKVADALFRVYCLRVGPESDKNTFDTDRSVPEEGEAYLQAVTNFLNSMRWDPSRSFYRYAVKSIKNNAYRIRMELYAEKNSRGLLSKSRLKAIAKKKKELREKIEGLPKDEQLARLRKFDKEYYAVFEDLDYYSEAEEITDKQLFRSEENYEEKIYLHHYFIELTGFFLHFRAYRKNATEPFLYPMWYAETVTRLMKKFQFTPEADVEVLRVADGDYLAFFLQSPCTTVDSLRTIPYRLAQELFPEEAPGVRLAPGPNGWLALRVPQKYLAPSRTLDKSGISRSRNAFLTDTAFIKERLFG